LSLIASTVSVLSLLNSKNSSWLALEESSGNLLLNAGLKRYVDSQNGDLAVSFNSTL
jgi:hypothetical protein